MIRADLVLGLCFAASAARGQVFNEPKYFGWLDPPETASASERLGRMIHQNVWDDNVYDPVLDQWVSRESPQHPIAVARCVAFRIMLAVHNPNQPVVVNGVERFNEPPVNPGRIAITLLNFGKDATDEADEASTAAVRFFVPAADNLPGISDFDFPNTNAPLYERKAYRHPFLVNATEAGPMRAWMTAFVGEYARLQATPRTNEGLISAYYPTAVLPDPQRFYFDTEAAIAFAPGVNMMYIPQQLIQNAALRQSYWNTRLVPGSGGKTLSQLYAEVRDANAWDPDPEVLAGSLALEQGPAALQLANRSFAIWWLEICKRAEAEVMRKSAYEVIRAMWPGTRVGNYDEVSVDGVSDRTGWVADRSTESAYNTDQIVHRFIAQSDPVVVNMLPRTILDPGWGGGLLAATPTPEGNPNSRRYLAMKRWSGGTVQMPVLYGVPISKEATGIKGYYLVRQTNRYLSPDLAIPRGACNDFHGENVAAVFENNTFPGPCETYWETTLRYARHSLESILNTPPAPGEPTRPVVPWLEMCYINEEATVPEGARTPDETRRLLMLLRSKNIEEACFFQPWRANGATAEQVEKSWRATRREVDKVYDPRISLIQRLRGAAPLPAPADALQPSRLEFTLRDAGGFDRLVGIRSAPILSTPPSSELTSELRVDFEWPVLPGDVRPWSSPGDPKRLFITVECGSTIQNVSGNVIVGKWVQDVGWQWTPAMQEELPGDTTYEFVTGVETPPAGAPYPSMYRTRRTFVLDGASAEDFMWWNDSTQRWTTTLKLKQEIVGTSFVSYYDLVQISLGDDLPMATGNMSAPLAVSDMNHDGFSDVLDAMQFVNDWDEYWFSADMNQDGSVDAEDVMVFFDALAEGN